MDTPEKTDFTPPRYNAVSQEGFAKLDELASGQSPATPHPFDPANLVYVSEIARSQEERVESFCKVLRDFAKTGKIGHAMVIFECEEDGKARLGFINNTELAGLQGKTGLLRAEELLWLELALLEKHGIPQMPIGAAEGLEWCRENLWKDTKEAK